MTYTPNMPLEEIKKLNIYEKFNNIILNIEQLPENGKVSLGYTQYKYATHQDITAAIKPIMIAWRVHMQVIITDHSYEQIRVMELNRKQEQEEKIKFRSSAHVTLTFTNVDNPEEKLTYNGYGTGADAQNREDGIAHTYAYKNALIKAFMIESGDEPDNLVKDDKEYSIVGTTNRTSPSGKYSSSLVDDPAEKFSDLTNQASEEFYQDQQDTMRNIQSEDEYKAYKKLFVQDINIFKAFGREFPNQAKTLRNMYYDLQRTYEPNKLNKNN